MSIVANQSRICRQFLAALRPHWRKDPALPDRIEKLLGNDRRLGSRDRRLYRELLYTTLRYLPWIEPLLVLDQDPVPALAWLCTDTESTAAFRAEAAAGWPPCPDSVSGKAAELGADPEAVLPDWLRTECPEAFAPDQLDALSSRSPLWIRMQTSGPVEVMIEFGALGWSWFESPALPGAYRVSGADLSKLTATRSYYDGRFEIQDIGSQLILASAGIEPGGRWLDACAGAGGKTLQLAWLLGEKGRVDAHDIRREALEELKRRSDRTSFGARIAVPPSPGDAYDGVLVDAPCSGSGTWRRHPHLKWTTRPADIIAHAQRQLALLTEFAPRVRPGGRLLYATCSLCRSENEEVVARFLEAHPAFTRGPAQRLWPATHDGDGFFVAQLQR